MSDLSGSVLFSRTHISSAASSATNTGSVSISASLLYKTKSPNSWALVKTTALKKKIATEIIFLRIKSHILNQLSNLNYNTQSA